MQFSVSGRRDAAIFALKARQIIPLGQAARGADLFRPAPILDNHCLVIENGLIEDITAQPRCPVRDLGDVAILPPLVNAHTHLQFSWLFGKTTWHRGFASWLQSLVPFVLAHSRKPYGAEEQLTALGHACATLEGSIVGDIGGSLPHALTKVAALAQEYGLEIRHFCEWFGFQDNSAIWPERCVREIESSPALGERCYPCGHALYSTHPEILKRARKIALKRAGVFTFHLAESTEETELLGCGTGPLRDLYAGHVLPDEWRAPGCSPFAFAKRLGLLGPGTLAVHGTQLEKGEIGPFAATGASLCLCARSNRNLGVGEPPVRDLLEAGILCCLGTDGLTSNTDLDARKEAAFLQETFDIPLPALWRLATVNGAQALGLPATGLAKGQPARFSLWPLDNRSGVLPCQSLGSNYGLHQDR